MLCKRHGAGIEPAVNDLRHASHLAAAFRATNGHRVNKGAVQFDIRRTVVGHGAQLFNAADSVLTTAGAFPDVQRRAPITVAADAPILHVLQPITEAAFADAFGYPVDGVVVADQVLAYGGHFNKPRLARVVNQRGVAPPAERIIVLKFRRVEQLAARVQIGQHQRVGLFDKHARKRCVRRQITGAVHQLHKRQVVPPPYLGVVLTKGGCNMHDTGTVRHGDVIGTSDKKAFFVLFVSDHFRTIKQRLVFFVFQFSAGISFQHLIGRRIFAA